MNPVDLLQFAGGVGSSMGLGNLGLFQTNTAPNSKDAGKYMFSEIRIALESLAYNVLASRITWHGLPPEIPPFEPERSLIRNGHVLAFKTPLTVNDLTATVNGILPGAMTGQLNAYGILDQYTLTTPNAKLNGKTFQTDMSFVQSGLFKNEDIDTACVIIPNTPEYSSDLALIRYYIDTIVELMVTYTINTRSIRMPLIMYGDKSQKKSFINQYNQLAQGAPIIMISDKQKADSGPALAVREANSSNGNLELLTHEINAQWNKMLTLLGVSVIDDKRERRIVKELVAEQSESDSYLKIRLAGRLKAVAEINKLGIFDEDIWLEANGIKYQNADDILDDDLNETNTGDSQEFENKEGETDE
ncbi:MAG: hypothetical protein EOM41_08450 [Bacilli bacterium]|nr:hypothetical protein [Bacilli bacterium]